jgi:outer membrane murein-binding lipoprotein Lpp
MRKIITAVLLTVLMTGTLLAGCGSSGSKSSAPAQTEAASEAETEKKETAEAETSDSQAPEENADAAATEAEAALEDGTYTAVFTTDNSMFHVNEANDGKGILTVQDGQMTIHVSLASKKIVNLYPGKAEEAKADGAVLLQPTTDQVTYSDGMTEEVYGFDIPVPAIGEEFDCALIGEKGKWYDHKVMVSDPVKN